MGDILHFRVILGLVIIEAGVGLLTLLGLFLLSLSCLAYQARASQAVVTKANLLPQKPPVWGAPGMLMHLADPAELQ